MRNLPERQHKQLFSDFQRHVQVSAPGAKVEFWDKVLKTQQLEAFRLERDAMMTGASKLLEQGLAEKLYEALKILPTDQVFDLRAVLRSISESALRLLDVQRAEWYYQLGAAYQRLMRTVTESIQELLYSKSGIFGFPTDLSQLKQKYFTLWKKLNSPHFGRIFFLFWTRAERS